MKIKKILFIILFLTFISTNLYSLEVILKRDTINSTAIIQLINENVILDSIIIKNVDYGYSKFEKIHNSLYFLIYENTKYFEKFKKNRIRKHQIFIKVYNNKIHIAFENLKESSDLIDLDVCDSSNYYKKVCNIDFSQIERNRFLLTTILIRKDRHNSYTKDTLVSTINFSYDSSNQVFYSSIDTLNGMYQYKIKDGYNVIGFKKVYFENIIVPTNTFNSPLNSFFLSGRWFNVTGYNSTFTAFREIPLNEFNLDDITKKATTKFDSIRQFYKVKRRKKYTNDK